MLVRVAPWSKRLKNILSVYLSISITGNEAKKTWEKLRNNHRDALRRRTNSKPKSRSGDNIKTWRFQDNMAFLIPHMAKRTANIHEETYQAHSDTRAVDNQENSMDNQESQSSHEETNAIKAEPPSTDVSTDQTTNKTSKHKRNTLNYLFNRSIEGHQRSRVTTRRERRRLNNNDFTCNNVKNDPLFHFFISMYETTKRLPPQSQLTIKTNVFSLVSQEESQNIAPHSPHSRNAQITDAGIYYSS